jgi:hypothetical protein
MRNRKDRTPLACLVLMVLAVGTGHAEVVNGYQRIHRHKQTVEPAALRFEFARPMAGIGPFEFAPLIEVTPNLLKGATPVEFVIDPNRKCDSGEKALCRQDCMDTHQQYSACEVKTVGGYLTRVCTCIDPALRAALEVCE